ncbi:hypothetical protein ACFO0N_13865 [Halobium salinum]|uniref:Zinc ribbon domain-containing protein n=1 Tax=Halobium salinum TaxID=1364940 RepID=A0ABD5PF20_9EURY|nr:hypothetical protein [Halobium salinum]
MSTALHVLGVATAVLLVGVVFVGLGPLLAFPVFLLVAAAGMGAFHLYTRQHSTGPTDRVNCTACGAPNSTDDATCTYCDADL